MFKEVVKYGGEVEEIILVEMTQEEMNEVRNETLTNLKKWVESGLITKEEYNRNLKDMGVN